MNKLLLLALGLVGIVSLTEGCGFGSSGCGAPAAPSCAPPPPVQNSCQSSCSKSCGCHTLRRYYHRRVTRDTVHDTITFTNSTDDDPVCNSNTLRMIITENLVEDAGESRDAIHATLKKKLNGHYAVICSPAPFHFVADSHHYCLEGNDKMTCYAFESNKAPKL
uniref:Ground-like domain-containing protein n=1 Tax=Plectus sambesii TaxID=2011161 RepID=A0A914V8F9_9BILA